MTTQPDEQWQSWIGREELRHDYLELAAARRWLATFDRVAPADGSVQMTIEAADTFTLPPVVANQTLYVLDQKGRLSAYR